MEINRKINDVHTHIGRSSIINQKLLPENIEVHRKKYNIENLMLFTLDLDIDENNMEVLKLSKSFDFIHGLLWIQRSKIDKNIDTLNRELGNGLVGVKFHGVFENLPATAETYVPVFEILDKKRAVLLIHCGRFKDGHPDSNSSYVHGLDVAQKFPHIKVVLAHMGGNDTSVVKKAISASVDIPNVSFDTSGISTPYRVEYAVEKIGADRIVFGSDFPWCSFRGMYYGVEDALIDEKDKELILRKNFIELIS